MKCPLCAYTHNNEGDRYGCPNCHGEGLNEMNPTPHEIKQARTSAGLTQQAAADLVGVSIKSWQAYEGGWRNIRPATWKLFQLLTELPR